MIPRFTTPATLHRDRLALAQRADAALVKAIWHLRKEANIQAATGRAIRAAAMLKRACTEFKTQGE